MADSARMRRGEPVSAAELAQVEGSADLVPQEHMSQGHMSQAQLMQLQAMEELEQQADEFWNVASEYPLPAKNLYMVRVLLLVVPSLIIVYYFIRVTLFPIGAVAAGVPGDAHVACHDLPGKPFGEAGAAGKCGIRGCGCHHDGVLHLCTRDPARPADSAGPCGHVLYGDPADGDGVVRVGGSVLAVLQFGGSQEPAFDAAEAKLGAEGRGTESGRAEYRGSEY